MSRAGKERANVVGIFGMGGVGKTTLTKVLFNQKGPQYTKASFLFDVREASNRSELPDLQSKLLDDIFGEKEHKFRSLEEGRSCLRNRLERKISPSFIGKRKTMAISMCEGSGWRSHHALQTLKDKCLLEEVEIRHRPLAEWRWGPRRDRFALRMHDHLRDLGREMANELSHPRRVWQPQLLKSLELKGLQTILAQTEGRCLHSIWDEPMGCQITYFTEKREDVTDTSLVWLQLDYQERSTFDLNSDVYQSIPSWIPLQNLQCLRISGGFFRRLWQRDMQAPIHLKELYISESFLEEFPDFLGKSNNMKEAVLLAKYFQMDILSLLGSLPMNLKSLNVMDSYLTGELASPDTAVGTNFKSYL